MKHLALPLRLSPTGALAALTQDTPDEVAQSVALLVSTLPGERLSVPGYGLADPLFGGLDPDAVATAIGEWEDRADPALVEAVTDQVLEQATVFTSGVDTLGVL